MCTAVFTTLGTSITDSLQHDVADFLTNKKCCSFIFVYGNEKEFSTHRAILGARSEYFSVMLTREHRNGRVVLPEIKAETMSAFLKFICIGTLEFRVDVLENLLVVVDTYQLPELKIVCDRHMMPVLIFTNAGYYLELAKQYNIQTLRASAKLFLWDRSLKK